MGSSEKKKPHEDLIKAGVAGASAQVVQRYGAGVKEHLAAYSGSDNEAGCQLKKSLKSISEQKVNPDYQTLNLKQQAGFSAEVKETAKANGERRIKGETTRKIRTDDLGRVNDPLYDHVELDGAGNILAGSGTQMKFVGGNPKEALDKLASKGFSKYLEADVKIQAPSDYYDGILLEADGQIAKLRKQVETQLAKGNTEKAAALKKRIADYEKIKRNLRRSRVSTQEAMFARLHPRLSTAQELAKLSHGAGIETARTAGVIGGSVSIVQNLVAVVKGELEAEQAAKNVAKDTAVSAAVGYGTGFVGASIKGVMQNAASESVRALSKTNLPGAAVAVALGATKTMGRYFSGEITGLECFEELGQQGTGMLSSSLFAVIGQAAIPIPAVGGLVGGMLGYAVASASYSTLLQALKEQRCAHEQRVSIEQACQAHIQLLRAYRSQLESTISAYLTSNMALFHRSFDQMKSSLSIGDIDGFISCANAISSGLGRPPQFGSMAEFDALMSGNTKLKL